ncbi:maleylpyruvate isomerase family mycothiol-dependent enzyme [Micromonospora sp. WMMA1923]|uniref:maleylpyruvate isomerase family mycothiol-dependent enzyme n=1 Tax=Micromonospora sp. WMMA1923 TaxID=3404125 RepID=UPI003B944B55
MTGADDVLTALRAETAALVAVLDRLGPPDWEQPTRCAPWTVRDMVGHVVTVLARVADATAGARPHRPDTTATDYYRPDHRFSATSNDDRITTACARATDVEPTLLVRDLSATLTTVVTTCRQEPPGRIVRTRHGDAMLLTDFLTTRLVEVAVHGLDVADALRQPPWLTTPAAHHLQRLLFGPRWRSAVDTLDWDPVTLLRKTTGRTPVDPDESAALARLGLRGLTLG